MSEIVLANAPVSHYTGWLVVEQDVLPDPAHREQRAGDQRRDREYLSAHGL